MVKKGWVVGAGLETEGLKAFRHWYGIEVGLGLDNEGKTTNGCPSSTTVGRRATDRGQPHPVPELRKLALDLCGGEVGGHGAHALADPANNALAQFPAP